jgi:hypothetical protein
MLEQSCTEKLFKQAMGAFTAWEAVVLVFWAFRVYDWGLSL